ncbi:hypothetical protein [Flavobacterium notoginsengisoli]|uniref:hypothetical protein n=1 Tax=Flavobacterium notoginsengisoli TaxID=1478199 RepID=UPI00362D4B59
MIKKLLFISCVLTNALMLAQGDIKGSSSFSMMSSSMPKPELFDEISFGGFDLISASLKYSKDNTLQKIVFSPFKLVKTDINDTLDKLKISQIFIDSKINFAQKDGISTFGIALGFDSTNPFGPFRSRIKSKFDSMPIAEAEREQNEGETKAQYEQYKAERQKIIDQQRINYFKDIAKNGVAFNIGYNVSFFEILGGDKVLNDEGIITNKYAVKAYSLSSDISYSLYYDLIFTGGVAYQRKRKSAEENQKLINYYGLNASVSFRAIKFLSEDELLNKSDQNYVKDFFIPSILIGVSFEYLKANGDMLYYENDIKKQTITMPFLDFKISPTNQFRLGFPIKRYQSVSETQIGLGTFVQYNISLADKSK